jgi:hypothetical protein
MEKFSITMDLFMRVLFKTVSRLEKVGFVIQMGNVTWVILWQVRLKELVF